MAILSLAFKLLALCSLVNGQGWGGFRYGSRSCSCGWRYGGQCKETCDYGDYILGHRPCAFGRYGVCCAKDLTCSSYGGVCQHNGCHPEYQTAYTYRVRCPSVDQTCCLSAVRYNGTTVGPTITTRQCPVVTSRILGGFPVNSVCQWPWMVSLRIGPGGPPICAGILLSDTKVLTTASCARGNSLVVTFGESDITQYGEAGEVNIPVSTPPIIHEDFDTSFPRFNGADIAILTLDERAPDSVCTSAACLPLATESVASNDRCWIAGWGLNEAFDGQLHEANVNVLTNDVCLQLFSILQIGNFAVPDDKLCSFPRVDQADACIGDNGGMLVCEGESGELKLFGIISDNACSRTLPVLYTDVQQHLQWIENNL